MKLFFLILIFSFSYPSMACSKLLPRTDQFDDYHAIVYGKVIAVKDNLNLVAGEISMVSDLDVTVEVVSRYNGNTNKIVLVNIHECSTPSPEVGDKGIFFIDHDGFNRSIFTFEKSWYKEYKKLLRKMYK